MRTYILALLACVALTMAAPVQSKKAYTKRQYEDVDPVSVLEDRDCPLPSAFTAIATDADPLPASSGEWVDCSYVAGRR